MSHPPSRPLSAALRTAFARALPALLACAVLGAQASFALVAPQPTNLDSVVKPPVWIIEQTMEPEAARLAGKGGGGAALLDAAQAVEAFRARNAGEWAAPIDLRTGKASLFQGSGIPVYPGAGNALRRADVAAGLLAKDGRPALPGLEQRVRALFSENPRLFLPDRGELVLNTERSGVLDDGRIAYVDFDWYVDGVQVLGARSFARMNSGNLVQAGTRLIGAIDTATVPRVGAPEAVSKVFAYAGLSGLTEEVVQSGRLFLLPVSDQPAAFSGTVGGGVRYRLVWEVAFRRAGQYETWTARVDALTGEVIEFYDSNLYAGQVTGGVFPRTVSDPEVVWPFPNTSVLNGSASYVTDINGRYPLPSGGTLTSGLDGKYVYTDCQECTNPVQASVSRSSGAGVLNFGTGGVDTTGNGYSSRADRNAFYHVNIVRLIAKKWLALPYLEAPITANVNINASCNAFYNGSVNFYRSSASCNNTGEISDVMQHEWGHGLDLNTDPGDGATGEATADTVGVHVTHSNLLGPYFRRNGNPVRNLDKATSSLGTLTKTNMLTRCPAGGGPLGGEVHCEGQIYGQTTWDLGTALVAKYGLNTGWRESERIFFTSMPQSGTYLNNQSGSIYDAYIAVDDDDGNLANGTPNGAEIYAAFNTHEIAGTPRVSSPHCARPAQPVLTATPGCDQIGLSWAPVPGAVSYRVQRHWSPAGTALHDVATVAGTSYTDTLVTPGLTYHYVVQAVDGAGCESSINTETLASPTSRPRLDAVNVVVDDTPAGNRTGSVDPGESVDVSVTLQNSGPVAAAGIGNVLSTPTPGVTMTTGTVVYPDLAPGASAPGGSAYRIAIAGSVPCGTSIPLNLNTTANGVSCPMETNSIPLAVGTGTILLDQDFEFNAGWTVDAAASTATAGGWLRGSPTATSYQPGEDTTPGGQICWFTGINSGGDSTNDVDGGETVIQSQVLDLTNLNSARLRYWRWFGQRDLGDDPTGDFFALEASNDGGSHWTTLERLGDDVNAAVWTQKEFAVESFLPLTSTMRFRVRVSDADRAGDDGDIIEGAIDDVRITGYNCDTTPPCFVGPTFAGLASASASTDCGGIDLAWPSASSHCTNAAMTYRLYRSTSSGFTPSAANLVASGVPGTGYHDVALIPGTTYYYIVHANDSRSGEDGNLVRRSVLAGTGTDTIPPLFSGVGSTGSGTSCGETTLSWTAGSDSCSTPLQYQIYRSTNLNFTPSAANLIGLVTSTSYVDAALIPGAAYSYVVRALDNSGNAESNTVHMFAGAASPGGGCSGCAAQAPVGTIKVRKSGNDVILDWTADPVTATRYIAYRASGATLSATTRIGSTTAKTFTHQNAKLIPGPIYYFVSAVNTCGQQSVIDTEP